ncbi:hypothetical protein D3C80_2116960 [compost metagenome]
MGKQLARYILQQVGQRQGKRLQVDDGIGLRCHPQCRFITTNVQGERGRVAYTIGHCEHIVA